MDRNTGRLFIIVLNKEFYYGKKLGHSLINPNQLKSYGTMVWDNPIDSTDKYALKLRMETQ